MNQDSLQTDITFIKSIMKTWENIPVESFLFERLPGLTNVIYKVAVTYPGVTPTCAIFRKFGNSGEIIDLEKENYVFKELAKRGVGPLYYGGDKSYRLEEYFDSTVLEPSDVHKKAIRRSIAKALAALHQAQVEGIEKTPMFMKTIDQGFWKKLVNDKVRKEQFTPEEEGWIQEILTLIGDKEVKFLKDILADEKNTVVFSHNDLHARNILLLDKSEQVKLVDYEYSAYNYRGYDIANFMNESAIDYSSSDYPYYTLDVEKALKKEDLEDFVQYYLFFSKFNGVSCDEALLLNDNSYLHAVIKETGSLEEFNQEASDLLEEVKICAMLSHYYWILWSVVMSKNDEIQFDYLHYAHGRFVQYQNLKKEYNSSKSSTEHATSETD